MVVTVERRYDSPGVRRADRAGRPAVRMGGVTTTGSARDTVAGASRNRRRARSADLPDAVRQRVLEWAAEAWARPRPIDVPASLARVARFAPTKRARLAGAALGQAVQNDVAFRALVAERAAKEAPESAESPATEPDLISAAARAYLLRLPDEDDLLAGRGRGDRAGRTPARRVAALEREVRTLDREAGARRRRSSAPQPQPSRQPASRRGRRPAAAPAARAGHPDPGAAAARRRQGRRRPRTSSPASSPNGTRPRAEAESWRQRAEAAGARADAASQNVQRLRESAGDRRAASDRRLELLLGALEGAASGLRREWDLIGGGPAPADVVAAGLPRPPSDAERTADPSRLTAWAGLPGAHLIVDGYNVTKTGFPS